MMNHKSGAGVQCAVVPDLVFEESSYDGKGVRLWYLQMDS